MKAIKDLVVCLRASISTKSPQCRDNPDANELMHAVPGGPGTAISCATIGGQSIPGKSTGGDQGEGKSSGGGVPSYL